MVSWRTGIVLTTAGAAILIAAVAIVFQDNIALFALKPRSPFQTDTPPPPPAYGARGAWALWPDNLETGDADVFYVHSTTYASSNHWNAPLTDNIADRTLRRVAAPNEAGPFLRIGAVYGPRYRQATLFSAFTHKFDGISAQELAYKDVESAFLHFLAERSEDRPFVMVGYGQGGLHVLGILQYRVAGDDALRQQLAAAYVIGQAVPMSTFDNAMAPIAPCRTRTSVRCVVSYIDLEPGFDVEKDRLRRRALIWGDNGDLVSVQDPDILCVNPISWEVSENPADAEGHLGAASGTGLRMRETPPPIASATSAQCEAGILNVQSPTQVFLRRSHWFGKQWRPQDFNLFYHDLAADADRRIQQLRSIQATEPVDLSSSPEDNGSH